MKKRRYTFWRWLLALLLGAGTWWLLSWSITPRVHFEATYLNEEAIRKMKDSLPEFPAVQEDKLHVRWQAKIWDASDRFLFIEESGIRELPQYYDVVDLQTGKMVVKHRKKATEINFWDRWHDDHRAHANGDNFGLKYQSNYSKDKLTSERLTRELLKGYVSFHLDRSRYQQSDQTVRVMNPELWSWNPITNEEHFFQAFPDRTTLKICSNCTAMLEIERATPLLPSFLLPLSIPNVLAAQVSAEMGWDDLALMRVWELPELKLRSSITKSWMHREDKAELSKDGSYLILCDDNLPSVFTSKHYHQYMFSHHGSSHLVDCYARSPTGIQIYDTKTGRLWWEKTDYTGVYSEYDPAGCDLIQFSKMRDSELKIPNLLLHLSTKQLIETNYCPSAEKLANGHIQLASRCDNEKPGYDIIHVMPDGSRRQLQTILLHPQLAKAVPQYAGEVFSNNIDRVPNWLQPHLPRWNWLTEWLNDYYHAFSVVDYAAGRPLLSVPLVEHDYVHFQMTDRWLVLKETREDSFKVSIFALPFPIMVSLVAVDSRASCLRAYPLPPSPAPTSAGINPAALSGSTLHNHLCYHVHRPRLHLNYRSNPSNFSGVGIT